MTLTIETINLMFKEFIGELKRHYAMNGSDYRNVDFYNNQHLRLRNKTRKFIDIADKYYDTIEDLIRKIGGEE